MTQWWREADAEAQATFVVDNFTNCAAVKPLITAVASEATAAALNPAKSSASIVEIFALVSEPICRPTMLLLVSACS